MRATQINSICLYWLISFAVGAEISEIDSDRASSKAEQIHPKLIDLTRYH